ncbi:MAG: hypothetical protein CSYNP_02856 [Syntrophus sp. SKADARSKE-3]|nr:hypothetical protein [Syntrophus sp. SKADARSKE-3]
MDEMTDRIESAVLENIQLFRAVDIESIRGIFDYCEVLNLKSQEILITPGKYNRSVFFILSGRLRVHLRSLADEPISILGPGDSVGEMSVIDLQQTSAYVVADEDTRILSMDEDILWSLVRSSHAIACNLLYILTKRLRHADSIISGGLFIDREKCHGYMDAVTGLPNRDWLYDFLTRHCHRASISGAPLSLILADIDSFRSFTDKFGKSCGDRMLYAIAYTMKTHLRPTEMIARYGLAGFAVLMPDTDMAAARTVAVRLNENLLNSTPVVPDLADADRPAISMGVAQFRQGQDADIFLAETDAALDRAKQMGGNAISE